MARTGKSMLVLLMLVFTVQESYSDRVFKFPRVRQEKDQWCWDACSQWIIGFHGTIVSQTDICKYGFTDGQVRNEWNYIYVGGDSTVISGPVYGRGINNVINHWGVPWKVKNGNSARYTLTESDFENEIEAGHPFVVRYNWNDNTAHFVVAIGYQNRFCWMMNPWQNDGIQIYSYAWVKDNSIGPLAHHIWDYTLQTTRIDTVPVLTTVFPANAPAVGEKVTLALTSTLNGRNVTKSTFFAVLTPDVTIDSATISWTQTTEGPKTIRFIREFGNARDTITKTFDNVGISVPKSLEMRGFRITAVNSKKQSFAVFVPTAMEPLTVTTLFSAQGRTIFTRQIFGTGMHDIRVNISGFSKGIYVLKLANGDHVVSGKVLF